MNSRTSLQWMGAATLWIALLAWPPAQAQWLNYRTPGIPRTADGKPDFAAPAPRAPDGKPDFSGLWRTDEKSVGETDKAIAEIQPQPWADAVSKKRKEELFRDDMGVLCQPFGPRAGSGIRKVIQTPALIVFLLEDLTYRQIYLDGRPLPDDPNPDWMGYSVGRWDGDTLVIESAGFNDRTWLDDEGHPHSESLHVTERLRRPNFGHLEIERTFRDPQALTKPWVVPVKLQLDADTDMLEYVCAENEKDRQHLVGHARDETKNAVTVAKEVLAQYPGVYDYRPSERPGLDIEVTVTLDGDRLLVGLAGGPKRPLTALSESKFFFEQAGGSVEFVKNDQGVVTELIVGVVEGNLKAVRRLPDAAAGKN
jgi:hypothetical protein